MMHKHKEQLRREIGMLSRQDYEEIPDHDMIGKTLRMVKGDPQFFYPDAEKVVQSVKRGSEDGKLYYVVYGDGEYHDELFLCPPEDFKDTEHAQKKLSREYD